MSYRGLKRALGETNIERKCRVGFGLCLAILIFCAFYLVDIICLDLITKKTNQAGSDAVDMAVVYFHWEAWHNEPTDKLLLEAFNADLLMNQYKSTVLTDSLSSTNYWYEMNHVQLPANDFEREILQELRDAWEKRYAEAESLEDPPAAETPTGAPKSAAAAPSPAEKPMPFKPIADPASDRFLYYQVVNWTNSCRICHDPVLTTGLLESEKEAIKASRPPFSVVKVEMPYAETRKAENLVRAILVAAGILTVFVAMIGLYLIVRYVIVKPLKHLRDVSDDISRGYTQQRADLHTNDEFEELADAFNRMLRHLTEAQAQLETINSKLDAKVDELAQANMQLYEMNRLKSDFLANMSHELRTPLNSIIGFSDVLRGIDSLTDKQRRYAENIQKSGRILLDMINDILDLAKLEAGKMEMRPSEFRLDAVIHAQCDMMRSLSEEKNIDLEVFTDPEAPPIYQDQFKVQQILTNLLSNAIKFTPEGGRVTVRAHRLDEDQMELTVADTGVGIPEEDRTIIFEKFRQSKSVHGGDGLTREYSGTGLGLSIVKELCKLLGGEISFVSELGKGS
ncbi:MAG: sensor histidine kinase, partial [Pirellulaceae bacterium]